MTIKSSLDTLEQVLSLVDDYFSTPGSDANDWETLSRYIRSRMTHLDGLEVLEILQFFRKHAPLALGRSPNDAPDASDDFGFSDLDLLKELQWQYGVARSVLRRVQNTPEIKDVRDALRGAQSMLSDISKLRERILSTDKIQEFMSSVMQILGEEDEKLVDKVLARFEDLSGGNAGGGDGNGGSVLSAHDGSIDLREGVA